MKIWGFGDDSDYRLSIHQSERDGRYYWHIEDAGGNVRLLPPMRGRVHGFDEYEHARADAEEVVNGLGADFDDLEEIEA